MSEHTQKEIVAGNAISPFDETMMAEALEHVKQVGGNNACYDSYIAGHEAGRSKALEEKDKEISDLKKEIERLHEIIIRECNLYNEKDKGIGELEQFLKDHEQWEADFISDNSMWWPYAEKDAARGKIYEKFLELQTKRNQLLGKTK